MWQTTCNHQNSPILSQEIQRCCQFPPEAVHAQWLHQQRQVSAKIAEFQHLNDKSGSLRAKAIADFGAEIKYCYIFACGKTYKMAKCYKPIETVISAWAATTDSAIGRILMAQPAQAIVTTCPNPTRIIGTCWCDKHVRGAWLTDITRSYVFTLAACAVWYTRKLNCLKLDTVHGRIVHK